MISCILIDDEQHCIDTLRAMLAAKFEDSVVVAGSTTDSRKAAALIAEHQPQIVFMDVEMPHLTGIQLMHALPARNFALIFTTAHDKYALPALKTEAVDYLLKPISMRELEEAVAKAVHRLGSFEVVPKRPAGGHKLLLPTHDGILAVTITDIIRIEAHRNYSHFTVAGREKTVVAKTLKEYETLLRPNGFFRVHQSHLVNLHCVEAFHPGLEEYVVLANGERIEVSRRRKGAFLEALAGL